MNRFDPHPHADLQSLPRLYTDLAEWWPLLSAPDDYMEEAEIFRRALTDACSPPPRSLLELGSGGGNNASHLRRHFDVTLVDASPDMLTVSRRLNPRCGHIEGDMRDLRLGRLFDAVFIHDAIVYMTTAGDLRRALETAAAHCRVDGAVLVVPDHVRETFKPASGYGGCDEDGRGARYLQWSWDPDPTDSSYVIDFAVMLRDADGSVRVEHERHVCGLFARNEWLGMLEQAGLAADVLPFEHSEVEPGSCEMFLGVKH